MGGNNQRKEGRGKSVGEKIERVEKRYFCISRRFGHAPRTDDIAVARQDENGIWLLDSPTALDKAESLELSEWLKKRAK